MQAGQGWGVSAVSGASSGASVSRRVAMCGCTCTRKAAPALACAAASASTCAAWQAGHVSGRRSAWNASAICAQGAAVASMSTGNCYAPSAACALQSHKGITG